MRRSGVVEFMSGERSKRPPPYTPSAAERGNPEAIARGFLDQNRRAIRLGSAAEELQLCCASSPKMPTMLHMCGSTSKFYHGSRFRQAADRPPDAERPSWRVNGQFGPGIDVLPQPSVGAEQAEGSGAARPAERPAGATRAPARVKTHVLRDKTQLMFTLIEGRQSKLTPTEVTIMTWRPLGQWRSFVNAMRASVVPSPLTAWPTPSGGSPSRPTTTTELPGRQLIDEGERSRDPVAQAAQDGGRRGLRLLSTTSSVTASTARVCRYVSTVHYGSDPEDAENAAWIGEAQQMVYGDGGRIFKPLRLWARRDWAMS